MTGRSPAGDDNASPREQLAALIRKELADAYLYGLAATMSAGSAVLGYPAEAAAVTAIMAAVDACVADEAAAHAAIEDDAAGSGADSEERD